MNHIELKIASLIEKNKNMFFFIAISIIALGVRYSGINFVSGDMKGFLLPWYTTIENLGSDALKTQVGDYGLLYQTIIYLLVKFPLFSADTKYKLLSILFDFILAFVASVIVCKVKNKSINSSTGLLTYAIILLCPTVIFNSAYWGQCDSIYTCFCILTLLYFIKDKYVIAFLFYGAALAFKLQAIFLLPFILCYYFYTKKYTILNFFISLFIFWLSGIATYLNGRNILSAFSIYANQTHEYSQSMSINIASFWAIIGQYTEFLKLYAILFTIALLGIGLFTLLEKEDYFSSFDKIIYFACWTIWTCTLFLPQMHERYTYLLDITLLLLAMINKKYMAFAIVSITISTLTYSHYLFETDSIGTTACIINVVAWILFTLLDLFIRPEKTNSITD